MSNFKPEQHVIDHVDDFVFDLLSADDARHVESHCEQCAECRSALDEARRRMTMLQQVPPLEASDQLVNAALNKVGDHIHRRTRLASILRRGVFYATAASVLILVVLNTYYYRLAPSPYDLRLLGQTELLPDSPAVLRVRVVDRNSGQPLASAPITVSLVRHADGQQVQLAETTTDGNGHASPRMAMPDWEDGAYTLSVVAATPDGDERTSQEITLRRSWKLTCTTDKPVYQPGQVIHMRSLALRRPDLKPIAGRDLTFSITDPAGNVIFKQDDVTSRFGIGFTDCPLATEIVQGSYQIECRVGDTSTYRTVEIQKYVLPKFQVNIQLDEPFYQLGQTVHGEIECRYFFGKAVNGAEVRIRAVTEDAGFEQLVDVIQKTDADGKLDFQFTLPDQMIGLEQRSGAARFQVVATATDPAGQQNVKVVGRSVTRDAIQLTVLPESGRLVPGVANRIFVYASYPDGRPVEANLQISGIDRPLSTDHLGIAQFDRTPQGTTTQDEVVQDGVAQEGSPQSSATTLTIKATDADGHHGRRTIELSTQSIDGDFLLRPSHSVLDGGDALTLTVIGGGSQPVFVDLLQDDQTVVSQTINVTDGRGSFDFDLPTAMAGTLQVCAYRFGEAGLAIRKSRTIYVRQQKDIQVEARLDQAQYRPGDKATIQLTAVDSEGNSVVAALSLAAVDEAVFSVLGGPLSGMQKTFFLLEQELLKPVYAIYDWTPAPLNEIPLATRQQFHQALFSATASTTFGDSAVPAAFIAGDDDQQPAWNEEPAMDAFEEPAMEVDAFAGEEFAADGAAYDDASNVPFTLAAASYPGKREMVRDQRSQGLEAVAIGWVSLVGFLIVAGAVSLAIFKPRAFLITLAVVFLLVILVAMLLPAVNSARESARGNDPMMWAAGDAMDADMAVPMAPMDVMEEATFDGAEPTDTPQAGGQPPRIRQRFPETLLWRPEVITDENGRASIDLELADSITSWRLTATAVTADGQLGASQTAIQVFQPFFVDFNLPVSLTRNDEVAIPVVAYNYLDQPQSIDLKLDAADWFEVLTQSDQANDNTEDETNENTDNDTDIDTAATTQTLELKPGEARSTSFRIKVLKAGRHQLQVTARGAELSDAVRRAIEVVPDGRRIQHVVSGTIGQSVDVEFEVPADVIDDSTSLLVKLYPSTFSQLVEGLDTIFEMPYGCFEQASSTTYPNVLALDYMKRTGTSVPAVEAKARQYIHLGYQRLISFEVTGGGFDWFGNPPANRTLTAYGLMEFRDMARVHDVDAELIRRTRQWLLDQRRGDGSWPSDQGMLNDGLAGSVQQTGDFELAATAYIAWAVFGAADAENPNPEAQNTLDYLLARRPADLQNAYLLAAVTNAIAAIDANHPRLKDYLQQLDGLKSCSDDGKKCWWEQPVDANTVFYGAGRSGQVETTSLAVLAMTRAGQNAATTSKALAWLVEQKDANGTWHSTQATVLALKALLAGTGNVGTPKPRRIEIALDGQALQTIDIPASQTDVVQQINLSRFIDQPGRFQLTLSEQTKTETGYQVAFRCHVEEEAQPPSETEPLSIEIAYDRDRLAVDDRLVCKARVTNNLPSVAPMVILDLPIPGGFTIERGELDELVGSQKIAKYQITPRKAIVYLRQLLPGQPLELSYRLKATMPVKVAVPDAQVYLYYDPDQRAVGGAKNIEVVDEA